MSSSSKGKEAAAESHDFARAVELEAQLNLLKQHKPSAGLSKKAVSAVQGHSVLYRGSQWAVLCIGSCTQCSHLLAGCRLSLTGWVQAGPVNRIKELCATFKIESEVFLCTRPLVVLQLLLLHLVLVLLLCP